MYQLPRIYLYFQNNKSLIKADTFDFKSLPTFPTTTIPPPLFSYAFKLKNTENTLSLEEVREDEIKPQTKYHTSKSELRV